MHALIATVLVHVSQDGVESLAFFSKREAKLSLINLENILIQRFTRFREFAENRTVSDSKADSRGKISLKCSVSMVTQFLASSLILGVET
jgi:hypothetical protein